MKKSTPYADLYPIMVNFMTRDEASLRDKATLRNEVSFFQHPISREIKGPVLGRKNGMVLAFTLLVMILISLMGIVILANTRTELSITGNTRMGRDAFNSADNCARLATFLTLALLNPRTSDITDVISAAPGNTPAHAMGIRLVPGMFTQDRLISDATNFDYTQRYLDTGAGPKDPNPHIIFSVNDREVAKAVVNLETYNLIPAGMGLGTGDPSDSTSGPKLQLGVVVSVTSRTTDSSMPTGSNPEEPNSIVTIMYRNYLN
jgi:hypothetical protein